MNEEKVRLLRLIEYIGDRKWVEETVSKSIKGTLLVSQGRAIRAVTLGDFPELLSDLGSPSVEAVIEREERMAKEREEQRRLRNESR